NTLTNEGLELIAMDGFDYPTKSDVDVFTEIAEDLLRRKGANPRISGIIIIYPTEDRIYSGALQRNLRGLIGLFLGRSNLDRLTILVARMDPNEKDPKSLVHDMRTHSQRAPIFNELISEGATIAVLKNDAFKHLRRYFSKGPISPPVYQSDVSQESTRTRVEGALGYYLKESIDMWTSTQRMELNESLKQSEERIAHYKTELERTSQFLDQYRTNQLKLQANQQKLQEDIDHYRTECERLTQLHTNQLQANQLQVNRDAHDSEVKVSQLTQRLQRVEAEYASLRSQVQLHNNYEQGEISQDLKNLNCMIERLGQSMSEHLVDRYVAAAFRKDPDDVTTLDAHDLSTLKDTFGHREGSDSLVASANGCGLNIENFIDFSIRARVCHSLTKLIFRPFHPFIDPAESSKHTKTYEQVRREESQYTAGKWRSITFKNIYYPSKLHTPIVERIEALTNEILLTILVPLAKFLFGWPTERLGIQEQHRVGLQEIITTAWEWSSKIKREVILLGDFQPTALDTKKGSAQFDPLIMEDFESGVRKPRPRIALCTLGLGLRSSQARGGGESPKEMLVHKMAVLTDTYYEDT
ncbi:hypothetical protein FRC11_009013, partial [Ceratobasidium sp. 423]